MSDFTLSELLICACADVWKDDGEVLATGIGIIPRIAQGLAKLTHSPALMITDGEAYLTETPVEIGAKSHEGRSYGGYMPYSRVFDALWHGRRHALVGPVQVDRWGQANISCIGDFDKPKRQMLGLRGFPGNSINHANSMFVPNHSTRVFVEGEVDVVCSVGYKDDNWQPGVRRDFASVERIVTNLCVMDFGGPNHALRVISLHPGVSFDEVQDNTSFPLILADDCTETARPSADQLAIIRKLDPRDVRARQIKDNPPGIRA
ncbi:MAG: ketoacid CoA transferase [Oceanococcus sp.]|nr:MAG: ketoacid CoA transferase [Oceanococcus sp.]